MSKIIRVREEWKNAPLEQKWIFDANTQNVNPNINNDPYPNRYLKPEDFPNKPVQIFEEVEVPD